VNTEYVENAIVERRPQDNLEDPVENRMNNKLLMFGATVSLLLFTPSPLPAQWAQMNVPDFAGFYSIATRGQTIFAGSDSGRM
jgi:hypothetical protein